jgi:hypothetical protein
MKIILLTVIVFIMSSQLFAQNLVDPVDSLHIDFNDTTFFFVL